MSLDVYYNLLRFSDGTLIVNPRFFHKIYNGYGFSASKRFEGLASDASAETLFQNPSESGRKAYIIAVEVAGLAQAHIDIYDNVSVTDNGTEIQCRNLNLASAITPVCKAYYGGTYTPAEGKIHETVLPGGSRIRALGSQAEVGECVVIPENHNMMVRITNKSASTSDFSIRFLWWEETL